MTLNHIILPGTIQFYKGQVNVWTWGEALAVLDILGRYSFDSVWYVRNGAWTVRKAKNLAVSDDCCMRELNFMIQFTGGPGTAKETRSGYKYFKGCLRTLVLDRVLRTCRRIGKAQTQRRIFQTIAKMRRIENERMAVFNVRS
jgi:hypothetical protein